MATSTEFIEYIKNQLSSFENVRARKMFGEYMVYVDDKGVLLVCDNTVFVKILPELYEPMHRSEKGLPYPGAKEHYILDIDDRELVYKVVSILVKVISPPKHKKSKKSVVS